MRAVIVQADGSLAVSETPAPTPGPGEVLVKVAAAGVNRADILQAQGHYPPPKGASEILGLEVSGTIADPNGTMWETGAPVVALLAGGGYAEYVAVPAGQVVSPPPGVDLINAAGVLEVAATALSNFDHVSLRPGESVLIHGGTGGVGSFAIQYCKALGCKVFATAGSADKLKLCVDMGAEAAFDYHGDWLADLKQATDQLGANVILDVMGAKYLELNVKALSMDGRLVIIGLQGGTKGTLDINRLLNKRALVTATGLRFRPDAQKAEICKAVVDRVWPLYKEGEIQLPEISRYPLERVSEAHQYLTSGENVGKIVLTM
ncbi:MAG: NAD(P)H-quinone oxidoreductase [Propionibacteriaceae bacterium]|jgi:putative PIG3 family NAD(P)H quinone oxidoreductase|nr:NAD(P)H-quinone oxidoreductase [Propionibacteriaceae bacterium]